MSNLASLTKSHSAIAAKKRARRNELKEIVFDEDARRDFLTGFHKRKVARREEAKKKAILREKQVRQEEKREQRRALAERAARNAVDIERAYGAVTGENDEWDGVKSEDEEMEEMFEGDEQLATVTVVQDFDLSALHGPPPQQLSSPPEGRSIRGKEIEKVKHEVSKSKKPDKIKYQTKAARLAERSKQRARRKEKAERAGGKSPRKGRRR